jgi:cell wall-associated NlpC family hydrolase
MNRDPGERVRLPSVLWGALALVLAGLLALSIPDHPPSTVMAGGQAPRGAAPLGSASTVGPAFRPARNLLVHAADGDHVTPLRQWQLVIAAARAQVGGRYAQTGDTPQTGFSCVGLVHWSFARAGIAVPEDEVALAQGFLQVRGGAVSGASLLPGDILLFRDTGLPGLSHAAIYAGGGMMVSADSPEHGVREEPLNQPFWLAHWALAVRVPGLMRYVPPPGG